MLGFSALGELPLGALPATGGSAVTINGILGTAAATGYSASVDNQTTISATLATATASGFTASIAAPVTVTGIIGTATADGFTASVSTTSSVTIAGILGTATAAGLTANVDLQRIISGAIATATAAGFNANIDQRIAITGSLGQALASGFTATIDTPTPVILTLTRDQALRLEAICRLHGLVEATSFSALGRGDSVVQQSISGTTSLTVTNVSLPTVVALDTAMLDKLSRYYGLIDPMLEQDATRSDGVLNQTVVTVAGVVTVTPV